MFVSRSVHFTLAVVCTLSLAGCIIAVDRKAETPKVDADNRIVRQVRVETHVKDDAVPAGCPEAVAPSPTKIARSTVSTSA